MAQGEHRTISHVPDTDREKACARGRAVCGREVCRQHLREEPYALTSARTDLCGEYQATGILTRDLVNSYRSSKRLVVW